MYGHASFPVLRHRVGGKGGDPMAKKEIMLHVAELFDLPGDLAAGLPHM